MRHPRKCSSRAVQVVSGVVDESLNNADIGIGQRDSTRILSASGNKRHRHVHREMNISGNRIQRLNKKAIDNFKSLEIMEELREKDVLLKKIKKKYAKSEKNVQRVQMECKKLRGLLEERTLYHQDLTLMVEKLQQEKDNLLKIGKKLNDENLQYKEDVSLLKMLIYRLNVEIERYQEKWRLSNKEKTRLNLSGERRRKEEEEGQEVIIDPMTEKKKMSESWGGVDLHALGPLLEAYQENLEEKESLIKQYASEINNFSGRCKQVVAENENLRLEREQINSRYEKCWSELVTLRDTLLILKEQNELVTKQLAVEKIQIQDVRNVYEKKIESFSHDNDKLKSDYLSCTTEVSNIRGKYEILNEAYEKMKKNTDKSIPVTVHTSTIDECKRLFEQLKNQYDLEKTKLMDRIRDLEASNPQNEKQLIIVTAERDQLRKQLKDLEKYSKRTRRKVENLQRAVFSIQISRDSFKRQLTKMRVYSEQLLAEQEKLIGEREELLTLLNEREKENENIHHLGNNIAHRIGHLKSQLQSVEKGAKEQLENAEKHLRIQEKGVGRLKTDYNRELERLKNLVKQKEAIIGQLQREKVAIRDNLELVWKAATSDDKKVKDALKNTRIYNI